MKKIYSVEIPLTATVVYVVEAESEEDAKQVVLNGECLYNRDIINWEEDMDSNSWTVWREED